MTGDEVERSIEFLLKNQATVETQIERTSRQIEETNKRLDMYMGENNKRLEETNTHIEETNKRLDIYAETQTEFIQVVTRHIEAQGEINASIRETVSEIKTSMRDAVLGINTSMREGVTVINTSISELAAAQMRTDARLDRLAETVERFITEGRNGKS